MGVDGEKGERERETAASTVGMKFETQKAEDRERARAHERKGNAFSNTLQRVDLNPLRFLSFGEGVKGGRREHCH